MALLPCAIREERYWALASEALELTVKLGTFGAKDHLTYFLMLLEGVLIKLTITAFAGEQALPIKNLLALLQTYLLGQLSLKISLLHLVEYHCLVMNVISSATITVLLVAYLVIMLTRSQATFLRRY